MRGRILTAFAGLALLGCGERGDDRNQSDAELLHTAVHQLTSVIVLYSG